MCSNNPDPLRTTAMQIVNYLADLWQVPVTLRQATNDQADDYVLDVLRQLLGGRDLAKEIMNGLADEGRVVGHMQCNGCGYTEAYSPDDVMPEEFQAGGKDVIMRLKEHFAGKGWQTSWGRDLCPECVNQRGSSDLLA